MRQGELSITVVVVVVLALLVLAVLAFVLLKAGAGISGVGVQCAREGGICQSNACPGTPITGSANDCGKTGNLQMSCCKPG